MTSRDDASALDRAADEALALVADDRRERGRPRGGAPTAPTAAGSGGPAEDATPAEGAPLTGRAPMAEQFVPWAEDHRDGESGRPRRESPFDDGCFPFGPGPQADPRPVEAPAKAPAEASTAGSIPSPREYEFLFAADDARESAPMTSTPWPDARAVAARAAEPLPPADQELGEALGQVLAAPLVALTDLPSFDTSAMDGWAVAGPGPWRLPSGQDGPGVLAGADHGGAPPLRDGHAVRIATGAPVPPGTTAVLRSEHGEVTGRDAPHPELHATRRLSQGQDIRPRGQECRHGDPLLPQGTVVTPAVLGLAAAAGYDRLHVTRRPRAEVLVLGDELLRAGLPHGGRIRDALGPMLGPWLTALGAEVTAIRRLGDDADALRAALADSTADVVLTTGGTAAGPVDHVHTILRGLGAELLVDGVAVRPGHPMLLARLAPGRHLVGLPGNPLAAVAGLLTLAEPLLRTLSARPSPAPYRAALTDAVKGHPDDTRLVPVVSRHSDSAEPLRFHGPAMLRGLAAADALAVVPPGGAARGARAGLLELPWAAAGP